MKTILSAYLIVINIAALFLFGSDKRRAVRHAWRIPERTLLLTALLGGSAGAVLGMLLFRHKIRRGIFRIGLPVILFVQACLVSAFFYFSDYYRASDEALAYLAGSDSVLVNEVAQGLFFDGPGEESALVFYPGAKVEYTAYAPLMQTLAENGTDCFLVKMPANFAFFGIGRADGIIEKYPYEEWYIGGHSLGGVAASLYAADHDLSGLILLAAYPTKPVDERTLALYGSRDGVLNMEKRTEGDSLLPEGSAVEEIPGGNHAYFGDYGEQKGDGAAAISRAEQQEITAQKITELIRSAPRDTAQYKG